MLFNYISLPIFVVSFAIGLLFVYMFGPETRTVYVYPTPENVDKILYKDKSNTCFQFEEENVECPTDTSKITDIPIQT
jgi:hypothetical protein